MFHVCEREGGDKADYLHNQLITDINVPSTYWECAESYLKGVGIYDVFLIEEQDFRNYKIFLRETGNFTKKQVFERTGFLRNLKKTLIQEEYKELLDEIEQCNTVQERLKGNVRNFLIRQGIHHVKEIDYRIRELYESELRRTKTSSKGLEYLKTLDRIKQFDIRKEMETLSGRNKERLKYEGQVIFLPYIPDQDIASDFDYIQDKSELVWDFSQKVPETLKKQIFQILCYALSRGFFYKNVQVRQKLEEAIKQPRRIDVQQPSEERNAADYNFQELKKDFNSCQSENQRLKAENEQLLQKCSILQKEVDTLKKRLDRKEIALLKKL